MLNRAARNEVRNAEIQLWAPPVRSLASFRCRVEYSCVTECQFAETLEKYLPGASRNLLTDGPGSQPHRPGMDSFSRPKRHWHRSRQRPPRKNQRRRRQLED